jgi:hypothetical protein
MEEFSMNPRPRGLHLKEYSVEGNEDACQRKASIVLTSNVHSREG